MLPALPDPLPQFFFYPGAGGGSNGLDMAPEDVHSFSGSTGELDSLLGTTLTEEQQQRIKRNRQLALERRQAKMQCNSQSQHDGKQL